MKNLNLLTLCALVSLSGCFSGCAFLHSTTKTSANGEIATVVTSYTLWDSKSDLVKFQNRGQKTRACEWAPGTSIGSVNLSSTSTNINDLAATVAGAVVSAAIKSVKP